MCGRYIISDLTWAEFREMLNIVRPEDARAAPSFNIAPTQTMPIVLQDDETREVNARWGLIPPWFRDDPRTFRQTTFNARLETAHEKPTFRAAWARGRCLVPTNGWYEWTGPKGAKQPWFITLKTNAPVFFFAGLYAARSDGLVSYTILTRAADPTLEGLHHRMPTILRPDQLAPWLAGEGETSDLIADLGTGFESQFTFHKTRPIRGDDESLIEPYDPDEEADADAPDLFS
ncbi:MAG: SOS response-associated peptidase [Pseudomonadota bacterium]